jgi:hypothetical protein
VLLIRTSHYGSLNRPHIDDFRNQTKIKLYVKRKLWFERNKTHQMLRGLLPSLWGNVIWSLDLARDEQNSGTQKLIEDIISVTHAHMTKSVKVVVHHIYTLPVLIIIIISLMIYSFYTVSTNYGLWILIM